MSHSYTQSEKKPTHTHTLYLPVNKRRTTTKDIVSEHVSWVNIFSRLTKWRKTQLESFWCYKLIQSCHFYLVDIQVRLAILYFTRSVKVSIRSLPILLHRLRNLFRTLKLSFLARSLPLHLLLLPFSHSKNMIYMDLLCGAASAAAAAIPNTNTIPFIEPTHALSLL